MYVVCIVLQTFNALSLSMSLSMYLLHDAVHFTRISLPAHHNLGCVASILIKLFNNLNIFYHVQSNENKFLLFFEATLANFKQSHYFIFLLLFIYFEWKGKITGMMKVLLYFEALFVLTSAFLDVFKWVSTL
jgi:hypothetical protein